MKVLGIDPGLDGGVALWDGETLVAFEIPTLKARSRGREMDLAMIADTLDLLCPDIDHAFIERVSSRPNEGSASSFKFGVVTGELRGLLTGRRIPITRPTPSQWKSKMGVGASKDASMAMASELFPSHVALFYGPQGGKRDGVAEAALIAWYGRHRLTTRKED
jgi:hypothetical protein